MAKDKKGFVLYADLIHTVDKLPDDKAGLLFKHLLKYVNDEEPETEDIIVSIAFEPIKQQLKRDLKHWEQVREKRSKAGKASADKRKQMSTHVESVEQTPTDSTVIGTVKVNDTVKVKGNEIKEDNIEGGKPPHPKKSILEIQEEKKLSFTSWIKEILPQTNYAEQKDELNKFFSYWTEAGPKAKKLRWEKEKAFDLARRLDTWFANKEKFRPEQKAKVKPPKTFSTTWSK